MMKEKSYEDIINLPHHVSKKYPQMSMHNRAGQFAPFAALTGHKEMIVEEARLTGRRIVLDEYEKELIDITFRNILTFFEQGKAPIIKVCYFLEDTAKQGGKYIQIKDQIKKIDTYNKTIHMKQGNIINMDDVLSLEFSADSIE